VLREQIFDVPAAESATYVELNGVPVVTGGNWWRSTEIIIRHLTRQTDALCRSHDST
jgi:hypothetical protein